MESPTWQKTAKEINTDEIKSIEAHRQENIKELAEEKGMSETDLNSLKRVVTDWTAGPVSDPTRQIKISVETITGTVNDAQVSMVTRSENGAVTAPLRLTYGDVAFSGDEAERMRAHLVDAIELRDRIQDKAKNDAVNEITDEDNFRAQTVDRFFGRKAA